MNREELKNKSICAECKHCKQVVVEHIHWTEYKFYCTNNIVSLDPVKGDEAYAPCVLVNSDAECKDFERPKVSKFYKFLELLSGKKNENQNG